MRKNVYVSLYLAEHQANEPIGRDEPSEEFYFRDRIELNRKGCRDVENVSSNYKRVECASEGSGERREEWRGRR